MTYQRRMRRRSRSGSRVCGVVALAAVAMATAPAVADIIASFHLGGGTFFNAGVATGWRFAPLEDITVTQLGIFDENQDGLAEGHLVGLFEVANPGIALATRFIDNADALDGDSRFEAVASVELLAGIEYYLLASNWSIDRFVFGDGNVGFAAEIDWLGFTDGSTNSIFSNPNHFEGLPGNLGPNFQFVPADCPADLDGSGSVGASDLLALLASWGPCKGCDADFDGDGNVGASDLLALLVNWGPCP